MKFVLVIVSCFAQDLPCEVKPLWKFEDLATCTMVLVATRQNLEAKGVLKSTNALMCDRPDATDIYE